MHILNSRRHLSNLVIDRGSLARLSIPFFIMAGVSITIVQTIRWQVMHGIETIVLSGPENIPAMNALHTLQSTVTTIGAWGLGLLSLLCLGLWIFLSHRIFGPTIPIRRHIQALSEGDYTSRINLRSGDELKDLAEELNHLAETLSGGKRKAK